LLSQNKVKICKFSSQNFKFLDQKRRYDLRENFKCVTPNQSQSQWSWIVGAVMRFTEPC